MWSRRRRCFRARPMWRNGDSRRRASAKARRRANEGVAERMTRASRQRWFWLAVLALGVMVVWLLREVLAPFAAGAAVAYLLDPVCDRLQRLGLSRTWATSLVTLAFILIVLLLLLLLVPTIYHQFVSFLETLPAIVEAVRERAQPLIEELRRAAGRTTEIGQAAGDFASRAVN